MDYKIFIDKLDFFAKKIKNTNDIRKKLRLINDYLAIFIYLENLGVVSINDMNLATKDLILHNKKVEKNNMQIITSFNEEFSFINKLTFKLLEFYDNCDYEETFNNNHTMKDFDKIDISEAMFCLEEFLLSFDCKLFKLFKELVNTKHISYTDKNISDGLTVSSRSQGSFVLIHKDKNITFNNIATIVHELGHCYEDYLTNRCCFNSLLRETSSSFLEKLFSYYCIKNNCFRNDAIHNLINLQDYNYDRTLINNYINYYLRIGNNLSIDEMTLEFLNIFDVIKDDNFKYLVGEEKTDINNYIYVLSDILANYFIKIYFKNRKEGLILFKKFLLTYPNKSIASCLNDDSLVETGISIKMVSNYKKTI